MLLLYNKHKQLFALFTLKIKQFSCKFVKKNHLKELEGISLAKMF